MQRSVWRKISLLAFAIALAFFAERVEQPAAPASFSTPTIAPFFSVQDATTTPDAPTPELIAQNTTATPSPTLYTVQSGDTLFNIAQQHDTTQEALVSVNRLANPNQLMVGQVLLIPDAYYNDHYNGDALAAQIASDAPADTAAPQLPSTPPTEVNGIAIQRFAIVNTHAAARVREIFAHGQRLGRNPRAFSKLGDSTIENPHFLARFDDDTAPYHLGDYGYLESVLRYYAGSFGRDSAAVQRGLHTWSVLDPMWARNPACKSGEHMLTCEFRLHNPSVLFVRMGTNDAGIPDTVEKNLRQIIEFCIENGVIPIIGTKADRIDGAENINNKIMRELTTEYHLPLWDFDLLAATLPARGLGSDGAHMTTFYAHDWRVPEAFTTGHGVHSLTALIMLDQLMAALGVSND